MNAIFSFIKNNLILAGVAILALLFMFFPKVFRFGRSTRRRRRRRPVAVRRVRRTARTRSRKPLPRSVGTNRRITGKGYAAVGGGTIPLQYNKNGTVKKAWQVKGTMAARSRMRRLRGKR